MRRAVFSRADEWFAVRDKSGLWVVVDANGHQPLASPDPVERCFAVHLAAAAPALRVGAAEMLRRWLALDYLHGHDTMIQAFVDGSISLSFPTAATQVETGAFDPERRQLELVAAEEVIAATCIPPRDRVLRLAAATARRLAL